MKANEVKKVYVIYNETTDVDKLVTDDLKDALICAGEQIDDGVDSAYSVLIYDTITIDDYYNGVNTDQISAAYSLPDFVVKFSIFENTKEEAIDTGVASPEVYHNLSDNEKLEVLHFIPDQWLINELSRRFREYRSASDHITSALDKMKIYV